jgi:hypothetical protein
VVVAAARNRKAHFCRRKVPVGRKKKAATPGTGTAAVRGVRVVQFLGAALLLVLPLFVLLVLPLCFFFFLVDVLGVPASGAGVAGAACVPAGLAAVESAAKLVPASEMRAMAVPRVRSFRVFIKQSS